jgi:hypothetical protein
MMMRREDMRIGREDRREGVRREGARIGSKEERN